MNNLKSVFLLLFILGGSGALLAQEKQLTFNPNSVYPVSEEHKLYKMQVWRRIDFNEKQNRPFFSTNNEITKILLDAVRDGRLVPYTNDSLTHRMTKEDFFNKIKIQSGADEGSASSTGGTSDWGTSGTASSDWGTTGTAGTAGTAAQPSTPAAPAAQYMFPTQLTLMEMKEEVYFDDIRSRMYNDIQALTIIIPAEQNATGLDQPVGTFKYKDLEQLFRSMPNQAIWYNPQNIAQNRNMADAFLLRLFASRVIKIANPDNNSIDDIYPNPKQALYQSQIAEYKLMEYEHDLWEY